MSTLKSKSVFTLTVLSAALMGTYMPARAADDADITSLTRPDSTVSVGAGYWSDDRPHQGTFDAMGENGAYLLLDADIYLRDDATGTWNTLTARNVGLDSREIKLGHEVQGNWGVTVEYNQMPRDTPFTINTGLTGIGSTNQTIGGTAKRNVQIGMERDSTKLGFFKNLMPGLDFNVTFRNEDKDGSRMWGYQGLGFLTEPIDSTTRELEMTLSYAGDRFQAQGGYNGTWYDNHNAFLTLHQGATTDYLATPPDNQAHQAFLNGGYDFTPTTRGTFKLAYTHLTQDDTFFSPITGFLSPDLGGATSLGAKVDTTLVQFGLSAKPMPKLSTVFNVRYQDRNDKTKILDFGVVENNPNDFTNIGGKAEAIYRLGDGYSVIGGIDYDQRERTVKDKSNNNAPPFSVANPAPDRIIPLREQTDETTYKIQLRKAMSETLNGSLAYLHAKRDGSSWYTDENSLTIRIGTTSYTVGNLIAPIHLADRTRDKIRLNADWTPMPALSLQFNVEASKDDYGDRYTGITINGEPGSLGMKDGKALLYSLDANYTLSKDWQLLGWYSHDETKARQWGARTYSSSSGGTASLGWEANLKDTGDTLGLGVKGKPQEKLQVGADVQWTRNVSKYPMNLLVLTDPTTTNTDTYPRASGGGAYQAGPLPDIHNKLLKLSLFAKYAVQKNANLGFNYRYERWRTDDWSWMMWSSCTASGTAPDYPICSGLTNWSYPGASDGTQVINKPRQSSNFFAVTYTYKF